MIYFLTGATGFIGSHVARQLAAAGHEVRALARGDSYSNHLREMKAKVIPGSLADSEALLKGMEGADGVFHLAALYAIAEPRRGAFTEVNVEGTRAVLEAARAANVKRVVVTSTHATIAAVDSSTQTSDETAVYNLGGKSEEPYVASKRGAEALAIDAAAQGQDVVIVNPTAVFGPGDRKPTPTGGLVHDFMRGKIPGYLPGGFNCAYVVDVARGHLQAMERGRKGERYILGGTNMNMKELLDLLAEVTRRKPVTMRVPMPIAYTMATVQELLSKVTGKPPMITRTYLATARRYLYFRLDKAERELGYTATPMAQALSEAVAWFAANPRG